MKAPRKFPVAGFTFMAGEVPMFFSGESSAEQIIRHIRERLASPSAARIVKIAFFDSVGEEVVYAHKVAGEWSIVAVNFPRMHERPEALALFDDLLSVLGEAA